MAQITIRANVSQRCPLGGVVPFTPATLRQEVTMTTNENPAEDPGEGPEDPGKILDELHRELQDAYPQLDWEGPVNAAVSRALQDAFENGRDYGNRHPD
jgi:hypothetical protein